MTNNDKFINNPLYLKWIFNSTPELDTYWENYIDENPEEAYFLLELKTKLRKIKSANQNLSELEKQNLSFKILKRLDKEDSKNKRKKQLGYFLKYAAVAVLFFSIGAIVVYLSSENKQLEEYLSDFEMPASVNGPTLMLSGGQSIPLNSSKSTLDYRNQGEIVLNKDSIIPTKEPAIISQLVMPYGNSSKVVLNDNTVVWLNAGSRLIYPSEFSEKKREVVLFGEAFFDVSKDDKRPFLVKTTSVEIKVLGTEFNVSAYPEDNLIQTVLRTGSVAIRRIGAEKNDNGIILKPNQMASFDKNTNQAEVSTVNTDFYTSWTDGLLSFENRDLNRIIKSLERYYNINIQFEKPMLGLVKISGKLDLKQDRNEVFEYLAKVSSSSFQKINERNYVIK